MDFKKIKDKIANKWKELVNNTARTLSSSSFTITSNEELKGFIKKSQNVDFENTKTKEKKVFTKRVLVIFWEEKSNFFRDALYQMPVLWTKAYSQNMYIKLAKSTIKLLKLENYKVKKLPSMVVFENTKVYKVIEGEENILKVVKALSLDINKTIDNI